MSETKRQQSAFFARQYPAFYATTTVVTPIYPQNRNPVRTYLDSKRLEKRHSQHAPIPIPPFRSLPT